MIKYVTGDFFDYKANYRINTVNCVGVMGAGVALEFKNRFPDMYKAYVEVCKNNEISPSKPFIWEEIDLFSNCTIINLPTKIHWKNPSEYEYIEANLLWLKDFLSNKNIEDTVTLPALGCGHGGLNWNIVKGKINFYLNDIKANILVFEPASSNNKLGNIHYSVSLSQNKVDTLFTTDELYPLCINKSLNINEIYYKGNREILRHKRISLLYDNNINEKELTAMLRILEEFNKDCYSYLIPLNNKKHKDFAVKLLQKGYNIIMVIPYGIQNFKDDFQFKEFINQYIIISYCMPNQSFKPYEYVKSLKYRIGISNLILYCSENYDNIKKSIPHLKSHKSIFYINYWNDSIIEFQNIGARKIGINAKTKKPIINIMQDFLKDNVNA